MDGSGTNVNEAVGPLSPSNTGPSEPIMQENTGREGVTAVGRCRSSESMRRIDSFLDSSPNGRKTLSCDLLDFHHGLLGFFRLLRALGEAQDRVGFVVEGVENRIELGDLQ